MVKFGVTDPQNLMVILLTNLKATVFTSKERFPLCWTQNIIFMRGNDVISSGKHSRCDLQIV